MLLDLPLSREYFAGLFASAGLTPQIAHRSRQLELVRSLVANGYGYTIANARPAVDVAADGQTPGQRADRRRAPPDAPRPRDAGGRA